MTESVAEGEIDTVAERASDSVMEGSAGPVAVTVQDSAPEAKADSVARSDCTGTEDIEAAEVALSPVEVACSRTVPSVLVCDGTGANVADSLTFAVLSASTAETVADVFVSAAAVPAMIWIPSAAAAEDGSR